MVADGSSGAELAERCRQLNQLALMLRSSSPDAGVLAQLGEQLAQAQSLLSDLVREGRGWSTITLAGERCDPVWREDDLAACMPFSALSGRHNPLSPEVRMWRDGDEVRGEARFSPLYAGPPDCVHGGIIAGVFDELLSMANVVSGAAGFTGTLSIRYHRHTPLDTPIELWAVTDRSSGRKQYSRGEFRVGGEVTASAEGLFILPAKAHPMAE